MIGKTVTPRKEDRSSKGVKKDDLGIAETIKAASLYDLMSLALFTSSTSGKETQDQCMTQFLKEALSGTS
jgi:hypothetical protein